MKVPVIIIIYLYLEFFILKRLKFSLPIILMLNIYLNIYIKKQW